MDLQKLTMQEKLDFLSEGTYGCAFKRIEPKNAPSKTVVKIQKYTNEAKREDEIGKLIRKIPRFSLYFAPILQTSVIHLGEVDDSEIKKCTLITDEENIKTRFVTNRIHYVGKYSLGDFVLKTFEKNPKLFLRTFFASYFDMLYTVNLLNTNGIVHFDLKQNNVMYDEAQGRPILIDFGMSLIVSQIEPRMYREFFFAYGYDYAPWCFEISVISYAVNNISADLDKEMVSEDEVVKLCNNFSNINPVFVNNGSTGHVDIFTDTERVAYNTRLKEYMRPFIGTSWASTIQSNLQTISTWDIYAVHVMFLLLLFHIHIDEYNNETFTVIQKYVSKLKREICAMPNERKSYAMIKEELMQDFGSSERKQVEVLVTTVNNAAKDDARLEEVKLKFSKLKLRELKKERQHFIQHQQQ